MKKFFSLVAAATLAVGAAWAQPKPKSQKEVDALMAIQNAATPQARIDAIENLLTKFADTEYKAMALQMAVQSAQEANDPEKVVIYGERTLKEDPKNFMVMVMLAQNIAQKTREFDLDKEEKLKQAEKYASDALEASKTAAKIRPDITDEQWAGIKKDSDAQAYEAQGLAQMVRKKYAEAAVLFKKAVDTQASPDAATKVRLASAYNSAGNFDGALLVLEAVLADPQLHPTIRQVAGQEKLKATQGKAAKK